MYIDNPESLQKLCDELDGAAEIFFDTEFIRERTFYPQLCLVQIGFGGRNFAVDPIKIDISPLLEQIVSRETLLIFHSGKQDLEILFNATGKLPKNVFDTQIAAMVCSFGEQVSYQNLVQALVGADIDKAQRFTDWAQRPLSEAQIFYALKDVEYLPEIYAKLSSEIAEKNRAEWLIEEEKALLDVRIYDEKPEDAWLKIKGKNRRQLDLRVLQELAKWRDMQARRLNKPRRRIISDEMLVELAVQKPKNLDSIERFRKSGNVSRETFAYLIELIAEAAKLPKLTLDKSSRRDEVAVDEDAVDMLKLLLRHSCAKLGVVAKLVADSDDLRRFLCGEEVAFVRGWRYVVFGEAAEKLVSGKRAFKIIANKFEVVDL